MRSRAKVLYVDDEASHRKVFKDFMGRYFEIILAESGPKGLEILKSDSIQVVVADQEMQGMNGIELLKEAQKILPHNPPGDADRERRGGFSDSSGQ